MFARQQKAAGPSFAQQVELVSQLTSFGFNTYQARYSLEKANWDPNVAAEYLFSHADEIPPQPASPSILNTQPSDGE